MTGLSHLLARCHYTLASWQQRVHRAAGQRQLRAATVLDTFDQYVLAIQYDPGWHRSWREWANLHYSVADVLMLRNRLYLRESALVDRSGRGQHHRRRPLSRRVRRKGGSGAADAAAAGPVSSGSTGARTGSSSTRAATRRGRGTKKVYRRLPFVDRHVVPALQGFFYVMSLHATHAVRDMLHVLALWFLHGQFAQVRAAIRQGFARIQPQLWLQVFPQLIAHLNAPNPNVRLLLQDVLNALSTHRPQLFLYPLMVGSRSRQRRRRRAAQLLLDQVAQRTGSLVSEARLVSSELVRVSALWPELWRQEICRASRAGQTAAPAEAGAAGPGGDPNAAVTHAEAEAVWRILGPMYRHLDAPETPHEVAYALQYNLQLHQTQALLQVFRRQPTVAAKTQLWSALSRVYYQLEQALKHHQHPIHLRYVSPRLYAARNLQLLLPGAIELWSARREQDRRAMARSWVRHVVRAGPGVAAEVAGSAAEPSSTWASAGGQQASGGGSPLAARMPLLFTPAWGRTQHCDAGPHTDPLGQPFGLRAWQQGMGQLGLPQGLGHGAGAAARAAAAAAAGTGPGARAHDPGPRRCRCRHGHGHGRSWPRRALWCRPGGGAVAWRRRHSGRSGRRSRGNGAARSRRALSWPGPRLTLRPRPPAPRHGGALVVLGLPGGVPRDPGLAPPGPAGARVWPGAAGPGAAAGAVARPLGPGRRRSRGPRPAAQDRRVSRVRRDVPPARPHCAKCPGPRAFRS